MGRTVLQASTTAVHESAKLGEDSSGNVRWDKVGPDTGVLAGNGCPSTAAVRFRLPVAGRRSASGASAVLPLPHAVSQSIQDPR